MNENRFWGLSDAERAELTEKQVREYCRVELMTLGVLEAKEPELLDETRPETEKMTVYVPHRDDRSYGTELPIAFRTIEDAEKFADLRPLYLEHEYSMETFCAKSLVSIKIERKKVLSEEEFLRVRVELERIVANKKVNAEALKEFQEATKAAAEVTDSVWDDWHRARRHARELVGIEETFDEYLEMCGGDAHVATMFLLKIHAADDVEEALGERFVDPEEAAPESA